MRGSVSFVVCVLFGCASVSGSTAGSPGPTPIVATWGDRVLRQAEVDAKASSELQKLEEQLYEVRVDAAEKIALEALVSQEAKDAGVSNETWLEGRLQEGLNAPSEEEQRRLFEQVRGRLPESVTFEDVKPKLQDALLHEAKTKRANQIFDALKAQAGFTVVLKPPVWPRVVVEGLGPMRGGANAKVTIIEFADFECSYCVRAAATLAEIIAEYGDRVRLYFRHYPLPFHAQAFKAAEASACADAQGAFWGFHDALFEHRGLSVDALKSEARSLGLDGAAFDECLDSGRMEGRIKKDQEAGQRAGVSGTPAYFVNGRPLSGAQSAEAFRKIIEQELAEAQAPKAP